MTPQQTIVQVRAPNFESKVRVAPTELEGRGWIQNPFWMLEASTLDISFV